MILQYKKNKPDVKDPFKKNKEDIGWDVYAYSMRIEGEKIHGTNLWKRIQYIEYNTFLSISPQPEFIDALGNTQKYFTYLAPRSSVSDVSLTLCPGFGTVDHIYRDSVLARFRYNWQPEDLVFFDMDKHPCCGIQINEERIYKVGDRCAQLIVTTQPMVTTQEVSELDVTDRKGGHGTSGR